MTVVPHELEPGLWRWQSIQHQLDERDARRVSHHHAFETADALVLVDPVQFSASQPALDALYAQAAAGRSLQVVMTDPSNKWHTGERICRKHGGTIWGDARTTRLLDDPSLLRVLTPGEPGPGGVVALDVGGQVWGERVIWVPGHRTLVVDSLFTRSGDDASLRLRGQTGDARVRQWFASEIAPTLEPLLELPVERIALRHGEGVSADAAEALLEALARGI